MIGKQISLDGNYDALLLPTLTHHIHNDMLSDEVLGNNKLMSYRDVQQYSAQTHKEWQCKFSFTGCGKR